MFRILLALFLASPALGQTSQSTLDAAKAASQSFSKIKNQTSNSDIQICTNNAGTERCGLKVTGSTGAVQIGPTGTAQEHSIVGKTKLNNNVWEDYFVLTNTATNTNLFSVSNPSQLGCYVTITYAGVLVGVSGRSGVWVGTLTGANTTPLISVITNTGSTVISAVASGSGPWTVTFQYTGGGPSNANSIEIATRTQCTASTLGAGGYSATTYTRL